ncbi:MAG: ISAzo13 family transposase, partial [Deltaproteobacteria bacterium]|nr:ISAzo13 family transposase [Deltaproteobacteria bacterium]
SVDTNEYAKGIKITDKEMKTLALEREEFHGEWNYTLHPRQNAHVIL